jgi:hypothetical protein
MKQTSVDFAFEKLANQGLLVTKDYKNLVAYREAKEMEKEQMMNFAEQVFRNRYNEVYKSLTKVVTDTYNETFNPNEK